MKFKIYATLARKSAIAVTLVLLIGLSTLAALMGNSAAAAGTQDGIRRGQRRLPVPENVRPAWQEPLPNTTNEAAAARLTAPDQTELKLDDGSGEAGLLQDGLILLNRFTPTSYPVKLDRLKVAFARFTNQPDPTGQAITLLIYLDPSGSGQLPASPQFTRLNATVQGTSLTNFFNLEISNGPTITAGDVYVGYQSGTPHNGVGFLIDNNSTPQNRTYFSTNNGSSFSRLAPATGTAAANALIRAEVSAPSQGGAPTLSSVTPNSVPMGFKGTLTIRGSGFQAVPKVFLGALDLGSGGSGGAVGLVNAQPPYLEVQVTANSFSQVGSYTLKVVNPNGAGSNTLPFTITPLTSEAEQEPNDSLLAADLLPIGGRRTGTATVGDPFTYDHSYSSSDRDGIEDLFAFQLTQATNVELILTQTAGSTQADLDMFLFSVRQEYGGFLEEIEVANVVASNEITVERINASLPPGRYLIGVSAYSGSSADTLTAGVSALATLSAANYQSLLAKDFLATAFGAKLATQVTINSGETLPTTLGGTTAKIRDSAGHETALSFFFVAPDQINFWIPPTVALGLATLTVTSGDGTVTTGTTIIYKSAAGLFTANGSGTGFPAAYLFRLKANGAQSLEPVARFDAATNRFVAVPIDFGESTDQLFLILYGTGFRGSTHLNEAKLHIGLGAFFDDVPLPYMGPQGTFLGLDQINVGPLPRSLAGRGEVNVEFWAVFDYANVVKITFK